MKPLRIALIMVEPPLPFASAATRWSFVLLKGLVERGHRVTALAACSRPSDVAEAGGLFPSPTYDLRLFAHPARGGLGAKWESLRRPYSYMFGAGLRGELARVLAAGIDVLHLELLWSGVLCRSPFDRTIVNVHNLYEIDVVGARYQSLTDRLRRWAVLRSERRLLRRFRDLCTLSPRLKDRIREISPRSNVHVVPLGLDLSLYPFSVDVAADRAPVVSLIGSFNWQPTFEAGVRLLERLWPEIKRRAPTARLQLVGRQARTGLRAYHGMADVTFHEDVVDVLPYFKETDVLLYAPSRGSGMKVKVLEAMALGACVVTTGAGVEGLSATDGVHAGICEDDAGLIKRTLGLLKDRDGRNRQRAAARELVAGCCGPKPTLDAIEDVYRRMLTGHAARA